MRKLFRIATLILLLFTMMVTSAGCTREYTDSEHVQRAREFHAQDDYQASIIELKNALKIRPDSIEARQLLGEVYLLMGNGAEAEKEIRRAIEYGGNMEPLSVPLAQSLMMQSKYQDVLKEINVPRNLGAGAQAQIRVYLGDARFARGQPDKAHNEYLAALALDENNALARVGLARLDIQNGELQKGKESLQSITKDFPEQAETWSLLGNLYARGGDYEKAEDAFTRAIDQRPLNQIDRFSRALSRIAVENFEGALKDIKILKNEAPQYFGGYYVEGVLELNRGNLAEAQTALETSLRKNINHWNSYYYLGLAHFRQGHLEQAELNLAQFRKQYPDSVNGRQMLALVKFNLQDLEAAEKILAPVVKSLPDDKFSRELMGKIKLAKGNPDEALEHLTILRDLNPDSASVHFQMGQARLLRGDTAEGLDSMAQALALNPSLMDAEINIIVTHIKNKEYDKALAMAEKFAAKYPEASTPLTLMAGAYMGKGEEEKARELLNQALTLNPSDINATRNLAKMEANTGNIAGAEAVYRKRLEQIPGDLNSLMRLAAYRRQQGDTEAMVNYLNQAIEAHPQTLAPRVFLGDHYVKAGQPEKALGVTVDMLRRYPESHNLRAVVGQAQLAAQQPFDAVNSYEKLVKLQPQSADARYLLATAYSQINEPEQARVAIEQALRLNPLHVPAKFVLARLSMYDGDQENADRLVQELKEAGADSTKLYELGAWIALARNQPSRALDIYLEASERHPESNLWPVKTSGVQLFMGDHTASINTLKNWLKSHPDDFRVRYTLANNYLQLGQLNDAEAAFRELLTQEPGNVHVLNNLAWLLREKDSELALRYAEKAQRLAPDWVESIDTLAQVLIITGDASRAASLLREAHAKARNRLDISYRLGQALASSGDERTARKVLQQLLEGEVDGQLRQDAQALLSQLE